MVRIDAEIIHHASYCKKLNSKLNEDYNLIDKVFILLTQDFKFYLKSYFLRYKNTLMIQKIQNHFYYPDHLELGNLL
jgi:hypothetical protein